MPRRNPLKSFSLVPVLVLFLSFFLSSTICHGQSPADMPLRQVISEAQALIGKGDFAELPLYLTSWKFVLRMKKILKWKKFFNNSVSFVVLDICKVLLKQEIKIFLGKASSAFGFFAEKFPNDPKAVMALQKRTDCLRALHEWKDAARVIELLLDPSKPYKKQILKRSELMNLYFGRAQCYHIEQDWVKGEPSFRELLKYADLAKDEDRSAYAVSCLTEMFVQTKRIDEVFSFTTKALRRHTGSI